MSLKAKWIRLTLAGIVYGEVLTGDVIYVPRTGERFLVKRKAKGYTYVVPLDGVIAQDTIIVAHPVRKRRA